MSQHRLVRRDSLVSARVRCRRHVLPSAAILSHFSRHEAAPTFWERARLYARPSDSRHAPSHVVRGRPRKLGRHAEGTPCADTCSTSSPEIGAGRKGTNEPHLDSSSCPETHGVRTQKFLGFSLNECPSVQIPGTSSGPLDAKIRGYVALLESHKRVFTRALPPFPR